MQILCAHLVPTSRFRPHNSLPARVLHRPVRFVMKYVADAPNPTENQKSNNVAPQTAVYTTKYSTRMSCARSRACVRALAVSMRKKTRHLCARTVALCYAQLWRDYSTRARARFIVLAPSKRSARPWINNKYTHRRRHTNRARRAKVLRTSDGGIQMGAHMRVSERTRSTQLSIHTCQSSDSQHTKGGVSFDCATTSWCVRELVSDCACVCVCACIWLTEVRA